MNDQGTCEKIENEQGRGLAHTATADLVLSATVRFCWQRIGLLRDSTQTDIGVPS